MSYAPSPSKVFFADTKTDPPSQPLSTKATLLRTQSNYQPNLVDLPIDPVMAESEHSATRQVRLDIISDNTLCLLPVPSRPAWLTRLTYFTFLGCLAYMMYGALQGMLLGIERHKTDSIVMWASFAGVPLLILVGALIYPFFKAGPLQYRFDRQSRLMTIQRCYGFSKQPRLMATFALDDVVALQLLYRYYRAVQAGIKTDSLKKKSFEMNLVFRNTHPPRVNLAIHSDYQWMRQAGARLAEFLDLPVLDQLCQS